jgi:hypothetical protein
MTKKYYPQFREKKTILIPVIKTKTLKTKNPPPILPCPPTKRSLPIFHDD